MSLFSLRGKIDQTRRSFRGVQKFSGGCVGQYVLPPPYVLHLPMSWPENCWSQSPGFDCIGPRLPLRAQLLAIPKWYGIQTGSVCLLLVFLFHIFCFRPIYLNRGLPKGGGEFHTAVRGTMLVRKGGLDHHASATPPSLLRDDLNLRHNSVTAQWRCTGSRASPYRHSGWHANVVPPG